MKASRVATLCLALVLALSACSGDSAATTTTAEPGEPSITAAPPDKTRDGAAVDSLEDVRGAIVRIVAEGSFADPEFGQQYNAAGSGSGFFVSSDGLAVTNNHVVTGAAFLQVFVEGEDEPRNARVLGVSECSDLAVIDVEGDGYPYLEWYEGDVTVGTEIFAAGFPLGDEEYTLLDGIISKEKADGESDWASVDSVIEHSADTLPGNSGGPIVNADGKVVAVNYAGDGVGQAFAIGRNEAEEVLPALVAGEDVTSIGINGQALVGDGFSGIWVASVASGSPADLGGIKSGDLVTLIEGLIPATDGTMADYCDILRSNDPDDPLAVEVYRASEDAYFEGTLNTDKVLALSFSFESELEDEVPDQAAGGATSYDSYTTITDANGTLTVDVPATWTDGDLESLWEFDGVLVGSAIGAAEDYAGFVNTWDEPGMFFGASSLLVDEGWTVESMLDRTDFSDSCDYAGRFDYTDPLYTGRYDMWVDCGSSGSRLIEVASAPESGSPLLLVQVQVISDADLEALDTILNTFVVDEAALASLGDGETAAPRADDGGLVLAYNELLPGDCFNDIDVATNDEGLVTEITTVSCAEPHDNEVVLAYEFSPGPYPGDDAIGTEMEAICVAAWPDYVGIPYEDSALYVYHITPGRADWEAGDRIGICSAYDGDFEPIAGSVFGSGR
jgi:serine protease Do